MRVKSYRQDKKQLDTELERAVSYREPTSHPIISLIGTWYSPICIAHLQVKRLRETADRDELLAYDEAISLDQQVQGTTAREERWEEEREGGWAYCRRSFFSFGPTLQADRNTRMGSTISCCSRYKLSPLEIIAHHIRPLVTRPFLFCGLCH